MAMPRINYGNRSRAYDRYAQALQMKLNAENQRRARDIDREGLFGTGIKTSHIKGIGDSLMSAYKIAHAAKQEKLTNLKEGHEREMKALYEGINSLPETGEGAKLRAKLGLQAIKAQENFNNQFQQFSDKGVTEFTRGGRESMVLNRLPKQTLAELETALSGESGAKVDGIMNQNQEDVEAAKTLYGTDKAGVATGTYVPPQIPIGHDLADMSDEEEANNPYGAAQLFPMGPSSNKQQMAQLSQPQGNTGFLDSPGDADIAGFSRRKVGKKGGQGPRRWGTGWGGY